MSLDTDANKLVEPLQELIGSLNTQIGHIQQWLKCRHLKTTQDDKDELQQLEKRITGLESTVSLMDEEIKKEEESLIFAERMTQTMQLQNKKFEYIIGNLPQQLPVINEQNKNPSNALSTITSHLYDKQKENISNLSSITPFMSSMSVLSNESNHNINNDHNNNNSRQYIRNNKNNKRKATSLKDDNPRATKRRRMNDDNNSNKHRKSAIIPQIEIVGKDSFDSVPKYVRNRLTQTRLNDAINEFNEELINKYRILAMHPSKMHKHQYDLHEKFMSEETKETKNSHYLTYDEFRNSKNITLDQTGKSVFNVLRHLKRIKMISGKKPKYVVII